MYQAAPSSSPHASPSSATATLGLKEDDDKNGGNLLSTSLVGEASNVNVQGSGKLLEIECREEWMSLKSHVCASSEDFSKHEPAFQRKFVCLTSCLKIVEVRPVSRRLAFAKVRFVDEDKGSAGVQPCSTTKQIPGEVESSFELIAKLRDGLLPEEDIERFSSLRIGEVVLHTRGWVELHGGAIFLHVSHLRAESGLQLPSQEAAAAAAAAATPAAPHTWPEQAAGRPGDAAAAAAAGGACGGGGGAALLLPPPRPRRPGPARKDGRGAVFARWLVATFGLGLLRRGGGVLDVAGGGKGGLAFELACRYGVPVTVVDPRPVKLTARHRRALARARAAGGHGARLPGQVLSEFPLPPEDTARADGPWRRASLVVGMHPDQATDAIVAQGLLHRKPFAVVPCCVFPESNPHRVLGDDEKNRRSRGGGGGGGGGGPRASPRRVVRTHEDLCCYLQGQSDAVRRDTLLMEGRNVVLFFKPKVL